MLKIGGIALFTLLVMMTHAQIKDTVALRGVTVTARRQAIERKTDRTVVNVEALATTGSNAWEVLETLPGIQAAGDNLSLQGKQHVTIFVDDKPLQLQGEDLTNYLRSLSTAVLDKIEIMTNPPAHYDAAGNGGIVNIRLKKEKKKGWNGNIVSENIQGRYARISQSLNVNLLTGRIHLYGNASNYNGTGVSTTDSRRIYASGPMRSFTQRTVVKTPNDRIMGKWGIDYYASAASSWSFSFDHLHRNSTEEMSGMGRQAYTSSVGDSLTRSAGNTKNIVWNNGGALSYQHVFNAGQQLSMHLDYTSYSRGSAQLYAFNVYGAGRHEETRNSNLPLLIHIYRGQADYVHTFSHGGKLETGYKATGVSTVNNASYSEALLPVFTAEGRFRYSENIQAAYLAFHKTAGKWALQAGLRAELSSADGQLSATDVEQDTVFKRHYMDLFPTCFLTYSLDSAADHQLHFSYSRRIDRPDYADLNPFAQPVDRYTYTTGNPVLQPQYANNYELAYLFRGHFTATLFYSRLRHGIDQTIAVMDNSYYLRPDNIGKKTLCGFSIDGSFNLAPWWVLSPAVLYTATRLQTVLGKEQLHVQGHNWNLTANQQFTFPHGWQASILTDYATTQLYAQFTQAPVWYIHAGIGKKLWNDKAMVRLNVRDVFHTRVDRQDINNISAAMGYSSRKWDTQSITLLFSYRFSKGARPRQLSGVENKQERLREQ